MLIQNLPSVFLESIESRVVVLSPPMEAKEQVRVAADASLTL
jgi:hypothetical protein